LLFQNEELFSFCIPKLRPICSEDEYENINVDGFEFVV
jgi:hypothetical protein